MKKFLVVLIIALIVPSMASADTTDLTLNQLSKAVNKIGHTFHPYGKVKDVRSMCDNVNPYTSNCIVWADGYSHNGWFPRCTANVEVYKNTFSNRVHARVLDSVTCIK